MKIETPRGTLAHTKDGTGVQLVWNPGFGDKMGRKLTDAQEYVDSECLRLSDPYTPMQTKMLIRSGTLGTTIGSGELVYLAPYARRVYYENGGNGIQGTSRGGKRGRLWFERMKADHKDAILAGARRRAGAK